MNERSDELLMMLLAVHEVYRYKEPLRHELPQVAVAKWKQDIPRALSDNLYCHRTYLLFLSTCDGSQTILMINYLCGTSHSESQCKSSRVSHHWPHSSTELDWFPSEFAAKIDPIRSAEEQPTWLREAGRKLQRGRYFVVTGSGCSNKLPPADTLGLD